MRMPTNRHKGTEGSGGSKTPVTTEAVVSTITTGASAPITTTIGSTTLFSVIGGGAGGSGKSAAGSGASVGLLRAPTLDT